MVCLCSVNWWSCGPTTRVNPNTPQFVLPPRILESSRFLGEYHIPYVHTYSCQLAATLLSAPANQAHDRHSFLPAAVLMVWLNMSIELPHCWSHIIIQYIDLCRNNNVLLIQGHVKLIISNQFTLNWHTTVYEKIVYKKYGLFERYCWSFILGVLPNRTKHQMEITKFRGILLRISTWVNI